MTVGNLWPGCSEVTAGFTSQVSTLCRRGLHQAPLHPRSCTALGQLPCCSFRQDLPAALGPAAEGTVLAFAVSLDVLPPSWHCPPGPPGLQDDAALSFLPSPTSDSFSFSLNSV